MQRLTPLLSLLLVFSCHSALSESVITGDGVLAIPANNSDEIAGLTWKHDGTLTFFNTTFKPVKKIKLKTESISNITQYPKGILITATAHSTNNDPLFQVIDVSNSGEVQHTWENTKELYWSAASDNERYFATTDTGKLLQLMPDGASIIVDKYPETSIYISVPGGDPIICITPNLTKLHSSPAKCLRRGKHQWEAVGEWRDVLRPFICGGYLVEGTNQWYPDKPAQLLVRNIQTGKPVTQKQLGKLEAAACTDGKIVYIDTKVTVANVTNLDVESTSDCGAPHPKSATLINDKVVCINQKGILQITP
jgi:hypothetical protein